MENVHVDEADKSGDSSGSSRRRVVFSVLLLHAFLVGWAGTRNAPVIDETAHMAAGLNFWQKGRFDLYRVNPPLVRIVAGLPPFLGGAHFDCAYGEQSSNVLGARPEWSVGIDLVRRNAHAEQLFSWARWACIPFSSLGAYWCWRWAGELYGGWSSVLALLLWCSSPNIMAWSATICPDAAVTALCLIAAYCFYRWMVAPTWSGVVVCSVALGLGVLAKTTCLSLYLLWPFIVIVMSLLRLSPAGTSIGRQLVQVAIMIGLSIVVINLGYAFDGSCQRLGDYQFCTRALAGAEGYVEGGDGGNRFVGTVIEDCPVPFPADFVVGLDLQKLDFERGVPCYLWGEWRERGWWYYYVVCCAYKIPLGTLGLAVVAIATGVRVRSENACKTASVGRWVVFCHALWIVCFVSSQTGINAHMRYVLPAFPFLFILISSVVSSSIVHRVPYRRHAVVVLCICTMLSSGASYPGCISYFNEGIGRYDGHYCLLGSNCDWGQDAYLVREWLWAQNPGQTVNILLTNDYAFDLLRRECRNCHVHLRKIASDVQGPLPEGLYVISVQRLHDRSDEFLHFLYETPVAFIGRTVRVYQVGPL